MLFDNPVYLEEENFSFDSFESSLLPTPDAFNFNLISFATLNASLFVAPQETSVSAYISIFY